MTKEQIRAAALAIRDAMSIEERNAASEKLAGYADALNVQAGQMVSGYYPIKSEIDLRPLMDALGAKHARLCLPAVLNKETIVFRSFVRGEELVDTGFSTRGPNDEALIVDPEIMLIPLAAFDHNGNRIGYGAGHYDRAVARLRAVGKKPLLIGTAFECQRVDAIPYEPHDISLHAVLTENGLHHFA